tara:strand:- start:10 stop:1353 length:1344 start_codon:yes stop_codon:yes gene_type:complete
MLREAVKYLSIATNVNGSYFFRDWSALFFISIINFLWLTKVAIITLVFSFTISCSQRTGVAKQPRQQFFQDVTKSYLPGSKVALQGVTFAEVDRQIGKDLILFFSRKNKGTELRILLNKGIYGIGRIKNSSRVQYLAENVSFLTAADMNRDGVDDLVLITSLKKVRVVKILFNNGKGYFYSKPGVELPPIAQSIERLDLFDLDQDGDIDFLLTGNKSLGDTRKTQNRQSQIFINNGRQKFEDATSLLWPDLPAGIVDTSIADYDEDGFPDVFLVYSNGQNRLLINNSVGKFFDKTDRLLPRILDQSTYADWADFDLDGDNDLLITNKSIEKRYQSFPKEMCYFLENDGYGRFHKRSSKKLPSVQASHVYLLDANGTGIPDVIILNKKRIYYLVGKGKWNFSLETKKRFPETSPMKEIVFGDINGDGFLDLLGIEINNSPKLWLNRVD